MLQSLPRQFVPSPTRLGPSNPNSSSLRSPGTSKPTSQAHQQEITLLNPKPTSSTLLSFLHPLPRAQALLMQLTSLATKVFDVSPNFADWLNDFRSSLPVFLSSQVPSTGIPPDESSASSPNEIISLFTSIQTQLLEVVEELHVLDLEDTKQKLNQEIETKARSIFSFAKKLKEAERVLDMVGDDYADYRRPKRLKLEDTENPLATTVGSQVKVSDVISYARKISDRTFAPPGDWDPRHSCCLPPAPWEEQMRASQLYAFADLDVGLPKTVDDKDIVIEPLVNTSATPELDPMDAIKGVILANFTVPVPSGWQPGMPVELPLDLPLAPSGWKPPSPPPGWKPGDPIPLPLLLSAPLPLKDVHRQPRPAAPPVLPKASEVIQVPPINIHILGDNDNSDVESSSSSSGEEILDDVE